ncbi:MAG: MerR family transcriptional regulator, partial [Bacteroidia bacterium]
MTKLELQDKLYYSISEVSRHFKLAPSLLRYWESEFRTIKPKRNSKGTRFYTKKDIEEISKVRLLVKEKGYTLQGAKEQLKIAKKKVDSEIHLLERLETIKQKL